MSRNAAARGIGVRTDAGRGTVHETEAEQLGRVDSVLERLTDPLLPTMHPRRNESLALIVHTLESLALATVVGLLAGSASAWLLIALDFVTATREAHHGLLWFLPIAGFCVAWVYLKVGRPVEGGSNLLIDEIHDPRNTVPLRMAPLIFAATAVSHLFGASVGREGTAVQMGGALADQVAHRLRLGASQRRVLLMAGISAGFASVFGTPLAGAVFGLEVLAVGRLGYRALLGCVVAAIVGDQTTTALWHVQHVRYDAGGVPAVTVGGLAAAVAAGAVFGSVGRVFAAAAHRSTAWVERRIGYPPLRPLIGGTLIAVAYAVFDAGRYAGLGIPGTLDAFSRPLPAWDFAAKAAFTVASLASGFKGGEVTPLFFIGATLGNALAPVLPLPCPLLAALGFVAVFAGAANTPLACTLMAMELFGAPIGVFAALACSVSYLFSGPVGIYRAQRAGEAKFGRDVK